MGNGSIIITKVQPSVQTLTIQTTGEYDLQALGGSGGFSVNLQDQQQSGGKGAEVAGLFKLTAGEQLKIFIGSSGGNDHGAGAGGGGGTFILANTGPNGTFVPLLIAAGGGGAGGDGAGQNGQVAAGTGDGGASGGYNGGGGGTGFKSIGAGAAGAYSSYAGGGTKYAGGSGYASGGYGGGGAGGYAGGGGGGGYSGGRGGASSPNTSGGGGGYSFNGASIGAQSTPGVNQGDGGYALAAADPTIVLSSPATSAIENTSVTIAGLADYGTTGIAVAGSTVVITDNGQTVATTSTDQNGEFSTSVDLLAQGQNSLVATITDPNGIKGTSTALVDTGLYPTLALTSQGGTITQGAAQTVTGSASYSDGTPITGLNVTLTDNGQAIGNPIPLDANGHFSTTINLQSVGANNIVATLTDAHTNTATSNAAQYNVQAATQSGVAEDGYMPAHRFSQMPMAMVL